MGIARETFSNEKKFKVFEDVPYGDHELQKIDLVIPKKAEKQTNLYVRIHGGAWIGGDKKDTTGSMIPFAKKRNMISANFNYRLLKDGCYDVDCSSIMDDIHAAMKKTVEICKKEGYELKKAILEGESAGAHVALMYAYKFKDESPVEIALVYSDCGPTDMNDDSYFMPPIEITRKDMLMLKSLLIGKELTYESMKEPENMEMLRTVSPITYVTKDSAPTILNSCGKDVLVPVSNGITLERVLSENGVDHYFDIFDNSKHCRRDKADKKKVKAYNKKFKEMIDKYIFKE
ncbi:MAG: alpha/beta hydrolase [Clostridia bacterium]|nr:alpha/beta hydrolase [Clostridia bacterium]